MTSIGAGNLGTSSTCIGSPSNPAISEVVVLDLTVVGVQIGALGQGVINTQSPLDRISIVVDLVFNAADHGLNSELANRSLGTDQPCLFLEGIAGLDLVDKSGNLDRAEIIRTAKGSNPGLGVNTVNNFFVIQASTERAIVIGTHDGVQLGSAVIGLRFIAGDIGRISQHQTETVEARRDVGDGVVGTVNLGGHLREVTDGAACERIVGIENAITDTVQTASNNGTEIAGQADVGVTVGPVSSSAIGSLGLINADTELGLEDSLQAVAEVFNTLEADTGARSNARGDIV